MKFNQVKQYLIKVGAICGGALLLLLIIYYFVGDYDDTLNQEIAEVKAKTAMTTAQYKVIEKQVGDAKEALEFYNKFSGSDSSVAENFGRNFAKELLSSLKNDLDISDLKFNMDPFQKVGGDLEKETVAVFASKVTVQFSANSDVDSLNLIKEIGRSFPGDIKIESFKLSRTREMNDNYLALVGDGKIGNGFVDGELVFTWRGIQDNLDYAKKPTMPVPGGVRPPGAPGARPPGVQGRLNTSGGAHD